MTNGLYISAMGLQVQQYRQSVIANNLANSHTAGFKRAIANVQARANAALEDPRMAQYAQDPVYGQVNGGVWAQPTAFDWSQGTLKTSPGNTDLALDGEGFFTLQNAQGEKLLTRDGQFKIGLNGELHTGHDLKVLDTGGSPITLNPALPVAVKGNGEITQAGQTVAKLGVVNVKETQSLEPVGQNTLRVRDGFLAAPAADTIVRQGYVEQSGVDPMTEIINMLEGQRAFDANAKMINMQDQMMSQLNTVGRVA